MNIFVTDPDPIQSAQNLPDKHIVKMPLETCQMLAIIYSDWYYGVGQLHKADGTPYRTAHGAFRNHPCTQWAAANQHNLSWLIVHGLGLCYEYTQRYDKTHTCRSAILEAANIYSRCFDDSVSQSYHKVTHFTRAMPESIKFDTTIDTITAYKQYLNTKPWLASNYLRIPSRKPSFIITTMTQSKPVYDFSTTPEQRAAEQAKQDAAIAAAQVAALEKSINDAPAVKTIKSKAKGLVPAKKAAKTSPAKKAGRVVGISADENAFLKNALQVIANNDAMLQTLVESKYEEAFAKLQARYNK